MMFPFSFQKGNKTAGCEDAPPVSNIRFSVVCDGLGGAGSTKHKVEEAGTVVMRTSGYLGSRVVADSVTDFYDVNYERIANILFCIQLLKLPDFQRLGMKNTLADADVTEFVQSQMRSIETLVSILENDSPLFEDLWSQAYFSTDRFERERQEISYSRGFSEVVAEAMNDPLHCRYITELTAQKIDSYRKMSNGMQVIQQKYMIEREKRKAIVPEQFYSLHEKELLDSFFRLDVSTLKSIFAGTNVSMDRLISFVEAKRVMSEIDDKLEKAQMNVLKIWNKYSPDYQLFKNIMEKGAV